MSTAEGENSQGVGKKIGFTLAKTKKTKHRAAAAAAAAAFSDEGDETFEDQNTYIPKEPLVIPCQKDSRQSLQEQARAKREKERGQPDLVQNENASNPAAAPPNEDEGVDEDTNILAKQEECGDSSHGVVPGVKFDTKDEDRAAVEALKREAAAALGSAGDDIVGGMHNKDNSKRVIAASGDTFQRQRDRDGRSEDQKKFEEDMGALPPDISVRSQVYKKVPISEFGAAMLRGMGWTGNTNENSNRKRDAATDATTMPRPARLGLGATPKVMASGDAPDTHSRRRPRRQDQLQRDERLKRQQEEMERERQRQVVLDKQRVLQVESIVYVDDGDDRRRGKRRSRGRIKQLTGVPGLNMILVQLEGDTKATKIKKGSIELVDRSDLNEKPFHEARKEDRGRSTNGHRDERDYDKRDRNKRSTSGSNSDDRKRERNDERRRRDPDEYIANDKHDRDRDKDRDRDGGRNRRDRDKDRDRNRERDKKGDRGRDRERDCHRRHRDKDSGRDLDRYKDKRKRDDERRRGDDNKRHQSSRRSDNIHHSVSSSWLIPNIRVRVVSSNYGRSVYKEKGVVVDVTRSGVATLKMRSGHVISVPERHLETALPKAGGNAIILSGNQRFSKGQLLERDGKKNLGVVQIFEDMSVVATSLDDMAEWCGPLDDYLEN